MQTLTSHVVMKYMTQLHDRHQLHVHVSFDVVDVVDVVFLSIFLRAM